MTDLIENAPPPIENGLLVPTAKTEACDNLYQDAYTCPANGWRPMPGYSGEMNLPGGGFPNLPGGLQEIELVDNGFRPENNYIEPIGEVGSRDVMLKDFGMLAHIPGVRDALNVGLTIGRWLK